MKQILSFVLLILKEEKEEEEVLNICEWIKFLVLFNKYLKKKAWVLILSNPILKWS